MLLGPTEGCTEAIRCLEAHLRLLKGNVNREVLEVFETEVGVRLIGQVFPLHIWKFVVNSRLYRILQKHLKRQIISLNGGFQVIADLNAYHAFISSLKVRREILTPSVPSSFVRLTHAS